MRPTRWPKPDGSGNVTELEKFKTSGSDALNSSPGIFTVIACTVDVVDGVDASRVNSICPVLTQTGMGANDGMVHSNEKSTPVDENVSTSILWNMKEEFI